MQGLFHKPSRGLIGVDMSSTSIKLLELSVKNNQYWVESYVRVPLLEGSIIENNIIHPEAVGDAISQGIYQANIQSDQVAFAIPSSMVITKVLEMDADMQDDEREVQIRMDAQQYIPFPLAEVSLDFTVLDDRLALANRVNVLLVATRVENVTMRSEVIELAGLVAKIADVETFAIENAFQIFADTLPKTAYTTAILDIGHSTTSLSVLQAKKVIYHREHAFGGKQLTIAIQNHYALSFEQANEAKITQSLAENYQSEVLAPYLHALIQQASRALQFFFSSSQVTEINHILLAGGHANMVGLPQLLQQKLGYQVSLANPFLHMGVSTKVDQNMLKHDAPALIVACGLALRGFT